MLIERAKKKNRIQGGGIVNNNLDNMTERYGELSQAERSIRAELESTADRIKEQVREVEYIDKAVTAGEKFADELRQAKTDLEDLKKERDKISDRLQEAVKQKEQFQAVTTPKVNKIILTAYQDFEKTDALIREKAIAIQKLVTKVVLCRGLIPDYTWHSPVASGHSFLLTDRDREVMNNITEELDNYERKISGN